MKVKKMPMRTCVITHEKCPKFDLIRVIRTPENKIMIDISSKANGRGAYIKRDLSVIKKARLSKTLDKHLEISVPDSIYDDLERMVSDEA